MYVAPMKALAQEVQGKFQDKLRSLGVSVRELTGDMQLSRKEIDETQVLCLLLVCIDALCVLNVLKCNECDGFV